MVLPKAEYLPFVKNSLMLVVCVMFRLLPGGPARWPAVTANSDQLARRPDRVARPGRQCVALNQTLAILVVSEQALRPGSVACLSSCPGPGTRDNIRALAAWTDLSSKPFTQRNVSKSLI